MTHKHDVGEEVLGGDGDEDQPVRHLAFAQRVVAHHHAGGAAGAEQVAERQAGQHDVHDGAEGQADVEDAQDVAEEIGVAGKRHELDNDGHQQQRPACLAHQAEGSLGADEAGEQEVEDDDDQNEEDDPAKRFDLVPPACA